MSDDTIHDTLYDSEEDVFDPAKAEVEAALGARGVFVGRPALWALGAEGGPGVARLLGELRSELKECLEQAGCGTLDEAPGLL